MARPTKYDEKRASTILDNLRRGNTRRASALSAGICEDTFANWLRRYRDFSEAVEKAEADAETAHVANIARWASAGNWQGSAWWLERRRKADWRKPEEVHHEHSGPGGGAIVYRIEIDRGDDGDAGEGLPVSASVPD